MIASLELTPVVYLLIKVVDFVRRQAERETMFAEITGSAGDWKVKQFGFFRTRLEGR